MDSLTGLIMDFKFDFNDTKTVMRGFAFQSGRHPDGISARCAKRLEVGTALGDIPHDTCQAISPGAPYSNMGKL